MIQNTIVIVVHEVCDDASALSDVEDSMSLCSMDELSDGWEGRSESTAQHLRVSAMPESYEQPPLLCRWDSQDTGRQIPKLPQRQGSVHGTLALHKLVTTSMAASKDVGSAKKEPQESGPSSAPRSPSRAWDHRRAIPGTARTA